MNTSHTPFPTPIDTLIIGGGLIGAVTAHVFSRAGHRVQVLDANEKAAAWKAGAGMLTPSAEKLQGGPLWKAAQESLQIWPLLAQELDSVGVGGVGYRAGLKHFDGQKWKSAPYEAQIHPPSVVRAALESVDVKAERALHIESSSQGVLVHTEHSVHFASAAIIAAGAWSADFGAEVQPVQGEALLLEPHPAEHLPVVPVAHHAGVQSDTGLSRYVLQRPDGVYVGATAQAVTLGTSSDLPKKADAHDWLRTVEHELLPHVPNVPKRTLKQQLIGLRPCTANGLPIVGPHPTLERVMIATGHGRHGALLAPWTAQKLLSLHTP